MGSAGTRPSCGPLAGPAPAPRSCRPGPAGLGGEGGDLTRRGGRYAVEGAEKRVRELFRVNYRKVHGGGVKKGFFGGPAAPPKPAAPAAPLPTAAEALEASREALPRAVGRLLGDSLGKARKTSRETLPRAGGRNARRKGLPIIYP